MENLELELKELVISSLNLEDTTLDDISSDEPLFADGLGLDSIDALELGVAIKKKYSIPMDSESEVTKKHFYSIKSLAEFINENRV